MSEITYQHFIGRGPEAEAIIEEANTKYTAFLDASNAFREERGYENVWQSHHFNGPPTVRGPVFKERLDDKAARTMGLKLDCLVDEGHAYAPHLGTKLGKELQAALDELNKSSIHRAKFVVAQLGMEHDVFVGGRFARTTGGFKDGVIVVKVPTGNGDTQNGSMPTPPPWLVPCKESEALAALGQ
jgi:hypothetical protein